MCIPTVAHSKDPVTAVRNAIQYGVDKGGEFSNGSGTASHSRVWSQGISIWFYPLKE